MKAPSVSVIVPLANAENWVVSLIEDIHNKITSRIPFSEIVLVDDQSKDQTWTLLRELRSVYDELRIFRLRESTGVGACSVRGILEAKSRMLFHVEPHCVWSMDIFWSMAAKRAELGKGAVFAVREASVRRLRERAVSRLFRDEFLERWQIPVADAASPAQLFTKTDFDKVHVLLPEDSCAPALSLYLMFMFFGIPVDVFYLPEEKAIQGKARSLPAIFANFQSLRRCAEEVERLRKNLSRIDGLLAL